MDNDQVATDTAALQSYIDRVKALSKEMDTAATRNKILDSALKDSSQVANALHTGSVFGDTAKILRVKNKSMCTRPPRKPKIFDLFCHAHAFVLSDDTLRFMPGGTGAPEIQPVFYKHSRIFAVQPV